MLSKRDCAIISAHTGYMVGKFEWLHKYADEILDDKLTTAAFALPGVAEAIKRESEQDFKDLAKRLTDEVIRKVDVNA